MPFSKMYKTMNTMKKMRKVHLLVLVFVSAILGTSCTSGDQMQISSPDGQIRIMIGQTGTEMEGLSEGQVYYTVDYRGNEIIGPSGLGLEFRNMANMKDNMTISGSEIRSSDETWERIWGRSKQVRNQYNELRVSLKAQDEFHHLVLILRAYNDGVALRYYIPGEEEMPEFELSGDLTCFNLKSDHRVWAAHYGSFHSHQESEFMEMDLTDKRMRQITGLPLLVEHHEDTWLAIAEADLTDWAGMYVRTSDEAKYTLETVLSPWPEDPGLLVRSKTPRSSPWRVIMIGDSPGDFIETNIIANLNDPNKLEDTSWIEPGKSAWDWWWCNRYAPDVDFELGPNTATMKYFIDLAAELDWEYQLVDWHWYGPPFLGDSRIPDPDADITTMAESIDIPELVRYGKERDVKILLWLNWFHADMQMDQAFPLYERWGVAGVKVDFMQRDDQHMVNFYHRLVKKAAEHHLIVDFHGAYKPTGISRTWPNLLTREGVMGNEYAKWSDRVTPEHKVTVPFTRGTLGEMDFTPGAFVNVTSEEFKVETEAPCPMTIGTRCNELALLVVYESPLQVLCDSPYNYRTSPAGTDFLSVVPTTWDETRVINASVGDYITVARRSGDTWYVGSMTDGDSRNLSIPLEFLTEGPFTATVWKDAPDADTHPTHLLRETMQVNRDRVIEASMAPGGGHVMIIQPE
jgi:alpha-glucosidase